MKVTIHSYDKAKAWGSRPASKGKTAFVGSDNFNISASPAGVVITATNGDWIGTGERGGAIRDITRKLTIEIPRDQLKHLLQAALSAKILEVSFSVPKRKPKKETKRAK